MNYDLIIRVLWFLAQAPLYKSVYSKTGLSAKIALTCHNFEPQGKGSMEELLSCGLQFKAPLHKDDFQDNLLPDKINILKVRQLKIFVAGGCNLEPSICSCRYRIGSKMDLMIETLLCV